MGNHLSFESCRDCNKNIAAISEEPVLDPSTTFKPSKLNMIRNEITATNDCNVNKDPQILASTSMDCCNMTIDDQYGIIHSPTTHKHRNDIVANTATLSNLDKILKTTTCQEQMKLQVK